MYDCLDLAVFSRRSQNCLHEAIYLLTCGDELDHFLQCPSPMLIKGDLDHLRSSIVNEDCTLIVVRKLEQLLAEVVAEWICKGSAEAEPRSSRKKMSRTGHQFYYMWIGLNENELYMFRVPLFQLLLQVATAMLIFTKSIDLAL